ncbi:MAG: class I SAM-dependent methyltransferase [Alphaproteobacteria bacterium]|nr:class I SAM-dependent methyltransferase [Alphaproteobacteria bacterium]
MRPLVYAELADWWELFTAPADYAEEAATLRDLFATLPSPPRTVLELGCGGGNNASHMKAWYALTLTDLSPEMLAVSRRRNPECEHVLGDMRTLRLGRTFDAVFAHDAIGYITTEADLAAALTTAYVHTSPGGAVLVAPDEVLEDFRPGVDDGGHDGDGANAGRAMRWLEWTAPATGNSYTVDYAILLRERDGTVRAVHDRHMLGVFPLATWLRLLGDAGFTARALRDPIEPRRTLFLGVRS